MSEESRGDGVGVVVDHLEFVAMDGFIKVCGREADSGMTGELGVVRQTTEDAGRRRRESAFVSSVYGANVEQRRVMMGKRRKSSTD